MAGSNQHHIPRLLMRGFKIQKDGKSEQVHLYRAGQSFAPCVNIMGINTQMHFYSDPEDSSLDDSISVAEREEFGPALSRVRAGQPFDDGDENALRRFMVHMMVRTESARTLVDKLADGAMKGALSAISNPDMLSIGILNDAFDLSSIAHQAVGEAIAELEKQGHRIDATTRESLIRFAPEMMRANAESMGAEIAMLAKTALITAPAPESLSGKAIQRKALSKDIAASPRVSDLESYSLDVLPVDDELILGDDPVLALDTQGNPQRALFSGNSSAIYCLPASSHHILVLRKDPSIGLPSVARLNEVSATHSRQHFIARSREPMFQVLAEKIGSFRSDLEQQDWGTFFKESISRPG